MPCSPPPGGVTEEQMKGSVDETSYGLNMLAEREHSWPRRLTPLTSPPTKSGLSRSRATSGLTLLSRTNRGSQT